MGLDQYAFVSVDGEDSENAELAFQWRKHARLQEWAEALFETKTGQGAEALNCGRLVLSAEDVHDLRTQVANETLPKSAGGFFYGHQFQDEQAAAYRDQDLQFCDWASEQIAAGETVIYSCWW